MSEDWSSARLPPRRPVPVTYSAFLSYVHEDNRAERGRILQLADDVRAEFGLITGERLTIHVDQRLLRWGDQWHLTLNDAILRSIFFRSEACRDELLTFSRASATLSRSHLLLPVLYCAVPDLKANSPDELHRLIVERQYVDWTAARLWNRRNSRYRTRVNELANELIQRRDAEDDADSSDSDGAIIRLTESLSRAPGSRSAEIDLASGTTELFDSSSQFLARVEAFVREIPSRLDDDTVRRIREFGTDSQLYADALLSTAIDLYNLAIRIESGGGWSLHPPSARSVLRQLQQAGLALIQIATEFVPLATSARSVRVCLETVREATGSVTDSLALLHRAVSTEVHTAHPDESTMPSSSSSNVP
jgi:hypothetical protein